MSFYGRKESNRERPIIEQDPSKLREERQVEVEVEVSNNEDSIANEITEDTNEDQFNLEVLSTVVEEESVEVEGGILKFKLFVLVLVCLFSVAIAN